MSFRLLQLSTYTYPTYTSVYGVLDPFARKMFIPCRSVCPSSVVISYSLGLETVYTPAFVNSRGFLEIDLPTSPNVYIEMRVYHSAINETPVDSHNHVVSVWFR